MDVHSIFSFHRIVTTQASINRWMNKHTVVSSSNEILLCKTKELTINTHKNMDIFKIITLSERRVHTVWIYLDKLDRFPENANTAVVIESISYGGLEWGKEEGALWMRHKETFATDRCDPFLDCVGSFMSICIFQNLIKLCTLSMCILLYVSYILIKPLRKGWNKKIVSTKIYQSKNREVKSSMIFVSWIFL